MYVAGTWLRRVWSSRRRYEWMGTHVHQIVLGVGLLSVDELIWCFCDCIWCISTWSSVMLFLIRWSSAPVEACFSHILFPHVSSHDLLFPTEFVQLVVLLSIVLDVWHCNQDSNVSVDLSLKLFRLLWRVTIWQCSMFLRFLCCLL